MKKTCKWWVIVITCLVFVILVGWVLHSQHTWKLQPLSTPFPESSVFTKEHPPLGYRPISHIMAFEKSGSYTVWFYKEKSMFPESGFPMPITASEYIYLTFLLGIARNTTSPLDFTGTLKEVLESYRIDAIFIESAFGLCTAQAVLRKRDGSGETLCLDPIATVELFIVLNYRRSPMPPFFAKDSLFEKIERKKQFDI